VAVNTDLTISATANGKTLTSALTVSAPIPLSLTFAPVNVTGGKATTATLTLNGPAPAGGYVVTITSDNANATPPATVTVLAGQTIVTFSIPSKAVNVRTVIKITAAANGSSVTGTYALTAS